MDTEPTAETVVLNETVVMNPAAHARAGGTSVWHAPVVIAVFLVIALVAAGAGIALGAQTSGDAAAVAASAGPGAATAGAPTVGTCLVYGKDAIPPSTNDSPAVDCSASHTTEVYAVGAPLPAPDAKGTWTNAQMDAANDAVCTDATRTTATGLEPLVLATKRFTAAFFGPTPAQARAGARWIRCDLVLINDNDTSTFTGTLKQALELPAAFNVCIGSGVDATATRCMTGKGQAVAAVALDLPKDSSTLDQSSVNALCKSALEPFVTRESAQSYATVPPFDPTQPDAQRVALCWVPVDDWKYASSNAPGEEPLNSNVTSV